jgi:hypothetical protein
MPIPKVAVEKYLNRQLPSLTWFKDLRPLEVEHDLTFAQPPIKLHAPLRVDQKAVLLAALAEQSLVILSDLGWGKSALSLELLQYYYDNGFIRRAFVFAPTDEVCEGWEDELKRWGFTVPRVRLFGSSKDKWDQLYTFKGGIVIGTYVGIAAMVSKLVRIEDAKRQHREIDARLLLGAVQDVDAVVLDQSTRTGNTSSLSFRVCEEFVKEAQVRLALAGRAFGRDPFVLWSQFYLTDRGKALGRSPGMFREAFWRRKRSPWGVDWVFRKRREPILADLIAASSLRYSIDECVSLPPKVYVTKECEFPEENWQYYDAVREELLASKGNYREVKNSFLRMRQISSGFVGFKDDDTGERAQIEFEKNPKLDLLMELIDEVPEDRKLVVFYEYTFSGARVCQELTKAKRRFGWLWSGTKNWTSVKDQFNDDPDFRILVAQWRKASMGLNLQSAAYTFFYESPVSVIERSECEGRTHRTGQKHKTFYYDLLVKDSVDDLILRYHKEGGDLFRALVENPSRFLGKRKIRR